MLANLLPAAWLIGVIGSVALLLYGGWLVLQFYRNASIADQHAVARLALHDSQPRNELLKGMKVPALVFEKESGSLETPCPQRVLIVEDNLDAVHSMATLIKMMGHDCQFAINGFAALEIARQFRPDIVLLDLGLPDFKGYEIATQLKWEPGLDSTRIIAVTALSEAERRRAIDAGCDEFYRKPLDPMLLEQLLAKPLGVDQQAAA
jgi:CheY-like chemotaxis protein